MNLRAKNLSIIGQLTSTVLADLKALWTQPTYDSGFEFFHIDSKERALCRQHGVNLRSIRRREDKEDWACFKTLFDGYADEILQVIRSSFPRFLSGKDTETFLFSGYYAMNHDDSHMGWKKQVMFILDNPLGHRLWCETDMAAPKAGDIVLMNPNRKHALYPAAGLSASAMATGPMQLVSVVYK